MPEKENNSLSNNPSKKDSYDADDIQVLKGLEGVRKRPAMYIGDQGKKGLHHLVFEVLDNSVDEAIGGYANEIKITLFKDNTVQVFDNGRGIPIDNHPEYNKPALEVIMEHLHSGGKFDNKSYKISGGLHGVGLSVVNALAEWLEVEICRDGLIYKQRFSRGVKVTEPTIIKTTETASSTKISFYPDNQIFEFDKNEVIFNPSIISNRVRELAFLTPQARFELHNKIKDEKEEFFYEGGIKEFISYLNKDKQPLHNDIIYISDSVENENGALVYLDLAMQYNTTYQTNILTYANTINTVEGGVHLTGFKSALTRTFNSYIENFMEKKYKEHILSGTDTREGLTAVISVKLPDPQFESQTKIKLGNPEVRQIVSQIITEKLTQYLEEHPQIAKKLVLKTINAKMAREAAQKARLLIRRKSVLDGARMPGKLADCSSNNPKECEIFIVEGDSAGGCFSGETKVALTDGRNLSFLELVEEEKKGKDNFCYTILSNGGIGIEKILNPRSTKTNAKVIKITLDSGDEIICTQEHLFLLRDGTYKQAQYLQKTDSLMPIVKKLSKKEHNYNHKIKSIEVLEHPIEVFDIEVPNTHNFALASGVFVHNSAKQGRDRGYQAILPLRGKILNVEKARMDKILQNNEILAIIKALGVGIQEFNEINGSESENGVTEETEETEGSEHAIDLNKLRYHKTIIMCDSDIDGKHIETLLLTFFFRYMRPLIDGGYLYMAMPPLYKVSYKKSKLYVFTDKEKEEALKSIKLKYKLKIVDSVKIQRYKGLGEMNPEELYDTTMNKETRTLKKVMYEDYIENDLIFTKLMGKEVKSRKKFIIANFDQANVLDI